jgi:hypothetical protein
VANQHSKIGSELKGEKKHPRQLLHLGRDSGTDRNRRVSVTLSPTLTLFLAPHGKLYLKLQEVLVQLQTSIPDAPSMRKQRSSAAKPRHGIPAAEWPNVLRRVTENEEPLREVAEDYGVSHETVRRTVQAARQQQRIG